MAKEKILVIEDEEDILELVQYNLTKEGYLITGNTSGEDGLRSIEKEPPDLIILDLMLPKIDGLEVCRILKNNIESITGAKITQSVDSNGIFAIIPSASISVLQQEFFFYVWDEERSEVRWMTSFDTQEEDILKFADVMRNVLT